jgi:ankyrin repeat protein
LRWRSVLQAAVNGQAGMCKVLLEHQADRKAVNKEGKTPVDLAKTEAIRKLLSA